MKTYVFVASCVTLAACSSSSERLGSQIPAADLATVRAKVVAAEAERRNLLGVELVAKAFESRPRTAAIFVRLGLVRRRASGFTYTPAGRAAGSRCGDDCVHFDLLTDRFAGVRSETIVTPGFREPGARRFEVELRVAARTPLARALILDGALRCVGFDGKTLPFEGYSARVPVTFFTGYDPAKPNDGVRAAGLTQTVVSDCAKLL